MSRAGSRFTRARGLGLSLAVAALTACTGGSVGWDPDAPDDRHPEVDAVGGHRLHDALPYFALGESGIALFLCRWIESPIPLWLPPDLEAEERTIFEGAAAAWEGAGIGVRFEVETWQEKPPLAGIVVEIVPPQPGETGNTIADCGVPQDVVADAEEPVDAALEYASIHLSTLRRDLLGRVVPLTPEELLGAVVHELGHALGFAGHVARGRSVLSSHGQIDATRRWGRRIARGETLSAPTVQALYAAPSGTRVGWLPLVREQLDPLRAVSAVATVSGLRGPYARVGESSARMLWRDRRGESISVVVLEWPAVLDDPTRLEARPNRRARLLVERAAQAR